MRVKLGYILFGSVFVVALTIFVLSMYKLYL